MELFSSRIRKLRQQSGELQRDLAKYIGVDVPMYSRYEHGERRPRREQVVKLARRFKVDADELVAQWLAEQAYGLIATDRMADRASQLLLDALGVELPAVAVAEEAPCPSEVPLEPLPQVKRNLVASLAGSMMPHYEVGDARQVMNRMEDESVDCIVTTPPYWSLRGQRTEGIAKGIDLSQFVNQLVGAMEQAWRVLKPGGSLWLNLADACDDGNLQAVPWRVVMRLVDEQHWLLRNDVVWNRRQGAHDSAAGHLRNVHEHLFHLVKTPDFYVDEQALRDAFDRTHDKKLLVNGRTPSGITGERYMRRIQSSPGLSEAERRAATAALRHTLARVECGEIVDFRLFVRQRMGEELKGDDERTRAINEQGFYILVYSRSGAMPPDVWDIEPAKSDIDRYVVAPDALYRLPIVATCPVGGLVLDPYCGTGTACKVAYELNRRSLGIDSNSRHIDRARGRVEQRSLSLF